MEPVRDPSGPQLPGVRWRTVIVRAATVITANTDEPMWSAIVIAKEMDSRGLLASDTAP